MIYHRPTKCSFAFSAIFSRERKITSCKMPFRGNSIIEDVTVFSLFPGEIGGQLGLCIGASLLTVLEFCDVIFTVLKMRFGRVASDPGSQMTPGQSMKPMIDNNQ